MTDHLRNAKLELQAAWDLGEVPPTDTLDIALWRATFIADVFYDEREIEPEQNLADILTDLLHYAQANRLSLDMALLRAERMAAQEREEWGIPHPYRFQRED